MENYNVVLNPVMDSGEKTFSVVEYSGTDTHYVALKNDNHVYFQGHTSYSVLVDLLSGDSVNRFRNLAIRAINNRTRERNFSRLSEMLASGDITEQVYEESLEKDADKYIITCDIKPTEQDIKMASSLATELMDVEDTDDIAVLFSFEESEIRKFIEH